MQSNMQVSKNSIYLERLSELVAHDIVEEGIDTCWHKEQNSRYGIDAER